MSTVKDFVRFKCLTFDVGQNRHGGSKFNQWWFEAMLVPNLDVNGWVIKCLKVNQTWNCHPI